MEPVPSSVQRQQQKVKKSGTVESGQRDFCMFFYRGSILFVKRNRKMIRGDFMKSRILIVWGIVVCLCLGACSFPRTELSNDEPEQGSSSSYTPVSLDYEVQKLPQDTMDTMMADGFCWEGIGDPPIIAKWQGDDELLFFLSQIAPPLPNNYIRIFSYQLSTDTLFLLARIDDDGFAKDYFRREELLLSVSESSIFCQGLPDRERYCRNNGNGFMGAAKFLRPEKLQSLAWKTPL